MTLLFNLIKELNFKFNHIHKLIRNFVIYKLY